MRGSLRTVAAGTPAPGGGGPAGLSALRSGWQGSCRPRPAGRPGAPAAPGPLGLGLPGLCARALRPRCGKRLTGRGGGVTPARARVAERPDGCGPRPVSPVPSLLCQVWGAGALSVPGRRPSLRPGRPAVGLCWPPRASCQGRTSALSLPRAGQLPQPGPLAVGARPGPGLRGLWTQERPWVRAGLPLAGACTTAEGPPPPAREGLPGGAACGGQPPFR